MAVVGHGFGCCVLWAASGASVWLTMARWSLVSSPQAGREIYSGGSWQSDLVGWRRQWSSSRRLRGSLLGRGRFSRWWFVLLHGGGRSWNVATGFGLLGFG